MGAGESALALLHRVVRQRRVTSHIPGRLLDNNYTISGVELEPLVSKTTRTLTSNINFLSTRLFCHLRLEVNLSVCAGT